MSELQEMPLALLVTIAVVLMLQGSWLFHNARARGRGRQAWFWGLWGMTGFPTPVLVYWWFVMLPDRRRTKGKN